MRIKDTEVLLTFSKRYIEVILPEFDPCGTCHKQFMTGDRVFKLSVHRQYAAIHLSALELLMSEQFARSILSRDL